MPTVSDLPSLLELGDEHFVSLTTFRKSGERVSTPVWIARDEDAVLVTTPDGTGKVKRLRNDSTVELQPCNRMGKTTDTDIPVTAVAVIEPETAAQSAVFRTKYGLEYRIFMFIERRGKAGRKPRVILRITVPA